MKFLRTEISDVFIIEPERHKDNRGFFARTFCEQEFAAQGIVFNPVQSNISNNEKAFTLRGMHYQIKPYEEIKLVRCSAGRIFDVAVDIRPQSSSYKKWIGVELSRENGLALYIPPGCAHGFLTLEDHSDVFYQMSPAFMPGQDRGFHWNDPEFEISWPTTPEVISEKDFNLPNFDHLTD
jgi:dTDP-4-dehydrorhamnose 3,5-epimerase